MRSIGAWLVRFLLTVLLLPVLLGVFVAYLVSFPWERLAVRRRGFPLPYFWLLSRTPDYRLWCALQRTGLSFRRTECLTLPLYFVTEGAQTRGFLLLHDAYSHFCCEVREGRLLLCEQEQDVTVDLGEALRATAAEEGILPEKIWLVCEEENATVEGCGFTVTTRARLFAALNKIAG